MHSTYSFIRTNAAAAVAWCAGFLTGFLTGAVMCFSHVGVLLVWTFEIEVPGISLVCTSSVRLFDVLGGQSR